VRFEGVVPPKHPTVLQGIPYQAVVPGNPYNTIYGQFVNYGPMKRWAAEDSAEHAYNLSKWRAAILKAKIQQAELSQQLMESAANMPVTQAQGQEDLDKEDGEEAKKIQAAKKKGEAEGEEKGREEKGAEEEEEERLRAGAESRSSPSPQLESEVGSLKKMLADVAEQTADALGSITKKISVLTIAQRARCVNCQSPRQDAGNAQNAAVKATPGFRHQQLAAVKAQALRNVKRKRRGVQ